MCPLYPFHVIILYLCLLLPLLFAVIEGKLKFKIIPNGTKIPANLKVSPNLLIYRYLRKYVHSIRN